MCKIKLIISFIILAFLLHIFGISSCAYCLAPKNIWIVEKENDLAIYREIFKLWAMGNKHKHKDRIVHLAEMLGYKKYSHVDAFNLSSDTRIFSDEAGSSIRHMIQNTEQHASNEIESGDASLILIKMTGTYTDILLLDYGPGVLNTNGVIQRDISRIFDSGHSYGKNNRLSGLGIGMYSSAIGSYRLLIGSMSGGKIRLALKPLESSRAGTFSVEQVEFDLMEFGVNKAASGFFCRAILDPKFSHGDTIDLLISRNNAFGTIVKTSKVIGDHTILESL